MNVTPEQQYGLPFNLRMDLELNEAITRISILMILFCIIIVTYDDTHHLCTAERKPIFCRSSALILLHSLVISSVLVLRKGLPTLRLLTCGH